MADPRYRSASPQIRRANSSPAAAARATRAVVERRLHTPHEALARGIGLDAAALPADTGYAVRDDLGVTELARDIARALEEQAVHHRARADSRADEDGDQALGSPPHPESVLAPGRRAHVVLHVGRQAERRFDLVTEGDIVPLEIGREN